MRSGSGKRLEARRTLTSEEKGMILAELAADLKRLRDVYGVDSEEVWGIDPEKVGYVAYARLFEADGQWLLVLASMDCKRTFPITVKIPDLPEGRYTAGDFVEGTPLGDMRSYGAGQLADGVDVELKPGEVHTFLVKRL